MDGQQCSKLSLTNRSIGLISNPQTAPCAAASLLKTAALTARTAVRYILNSLALNKLSALDEASVLSLGDLVVMARCQTPDPIPNSAVKSLRANGTAS